jgi:predicted transcriptional regulator
MDLPTPDELRDRREEELGLTQAELAERAGVSTSIRGSRRYAASSTP